MTDVPYRDSTSPLAEIDERFAPGGMYDKSTVTLADRTHCFVTGHDVHGYGTLFGSSRRCKHSVWAGDHRSVLSYGEYHKFPPAHREETP